MSNSIHNSPDRTAGNHSEAAVEAEKEAASAAAAEANSRHPASGTKSWPISILTLILIRIATPMRVLILMLILAGVITAICLEALWEQAHWRMQTSRIAGLAWRL